MATETPYPQSAKDAPASRPVEASGVAAPVPGPEAWRAYGQVLGATVRAKSLELSRPGNRKRLVPLLLAIVAVGIAVRDLAFSNGAPAAATAAAHGTDYAPGAEAAPQGWARSPAQEWLDQPFEPVTRNIFTAAPTESVERAPRSASPPKSPQNLTDGIQQRVAVPPALVPRVEASSAPKPVTLRGSAPARGDREQARQIRLQSTLMGARPTALINGRTVREGDVVAHGSGASRATFRVLRIEARGITLEREGIRFDIPLD